MSLQSILTQGLSYFNSFLEIIVPIIKSLLRKIIPVLVAIVMFIINIDYYKIVTHKVFIYLVIIIILYFLLYAYLKTYQPKILKKIIDFLTLTPPPEKKKDRFKFLSNIDLSVESK